MSDFYSFFSSWALHHAEGLVDPNPMNKKTVTAFRYPRACRFRKHQNEKRFPRSLLYQLFSKRDF
jgi:hypothetical protein